MARTIVEQGYQGPLQATSELADTSQPGGDWFSNADPSTVSGAHIAVSDKWHHIVTPSGGVTPPPPPPPTPATLFGARCGPGPAGLANVNYSLDLPRVSNSFSQLTPPRLSCERIYTGTGTQFPGFGAIPNTTSLTTLVSNVADPTATANGSLDSQYIAFFSGLTKQCFFSPMVQEPDTGKMTAAQAKACVDHVADIAADFPLVSIGVILTSYQIHVQGVAAMQAWCSTKADWCGVDCYGNYGIPALATMPLALAVGNSLASAMGQPLIVPEIGFGGGSGNGGLGFTIAQIEAEVPACISYLQSISSPCASWFESNKMPLSVSGADGDWCLALADGANQDYGTAPVAWQIANDASIAAYVLP